MRFGRALVPALTIAALVITGCGKAEPPQTNTSNAAHIRYVGDIDASPASITLDVKGGQVTGAVCQDARVSLPLDSSPVKDGKAELAHNATTIGSASIAHGIAVGTIELAGKKHRFRAERAAGIADLCGRP